MKYGTYKERSVKDDLSVTSFYSHGSKGAILKRVVFSETELDNVYNLAFGSVDENNEIDDSTISNNGDRDKVLATIVSIIKEYTEKYPERWIIFRGNTRARNRLYRMAVGLNLEELSENFLIYGYSNGAIIPFAKNMNTPTFLIKRKN